MSNFHRAAQVVRDLETLGVIPTNADAGRVFCMPIPSLEKKGEIMVLIPVPSNNDNYLLVQYAFNQEFSDDVKVSFIEDSDYFQVVLK